MFQNKDSFLHMKSPTHFDISTLDTGQAHNDKSTMLQGQGT